MVYFWVYGSVRRVVRRFGSTYCLYRQGGLIVLTWTLLPFPQLWFTIFLPSFLITDTFLSFQTLQHVHETDAVTPNIKVRSPVTSQHSFTARRRISKEDQRIINCHENCKLIIMEDNDSRIFRVVLEPVRIWAGRGFSMARASFVFG